MRQREKGGGDRGKCTYEIPLSLGDTFMWVWTYALFAALLGMLWFFSHQSGHCCATGYVCEISTATHLPYLTYLPLPLLPDTPTCSIIWQKFLIKCERQTDSSDSSCNSNSNSNSSCSCTQREHSTLSLFPCLPPSSSSSLSCHVILHVCLTLHICSNIGYSWHKLMPRQTARVARGSHLILLYL